MKTAFVRTPSIFKKVYRNLTWDVRDETVSLYLTFDDGPTAGITGELLAILNRFDAKATFFCIGRNVERHPELFQQILDAGHAVGNHTYSHLKGWFTKNKEYFDDIDLASQLISSNLFRPAYGMITPSQARFLQQRYRIVMWDVMSFDFDPGTGGVKCLDHVTQYARAGSIVVFHDSLKASEKMLYALPRMLEYFGEKGFVFKAIGIK
jgi:peptidoglycan/xylan/chitin deacetylase (PgdA/CDA1 family)